MQPRSFADLCRWALLIVGSGALSVTLFCWWQARVAGTFREAITYNQRTSLWALISMALVLGGYLLDRRYRKGQRQR